MYKVKEVLLEDLFNFDIKSNKSWFTKSFVNKNKGTIPVYGATKLPNEVSYGYVADNLDGVKYFEDCLTYNIDGTAGYIFYRKGVFSLSEKVKPLILNAEFNQSVDILYLKYVLEPLFRSKVTGRKGAKGKNEYSKINSSIIKNLTVKIPIRKDGTFDIESQKKIAATYDSINNLKQSLYERRKVITKTKVIIEQESTTKDFKLEELFLPKNGNGRYTKTYCKQNIGEYPVFTGTTIGDFGFIAKYDYDYDQLTFTTDGENAGTLEVLSGKYSVGGHRTILVPKIENINLYFFKYILEDVLSKKYKRGDVPSVRWNNIKNEIVSVPIDSNGNLDIDTQEEIASKYQFIDNIKFQITNKIDDLLKQNIKII